MNQTLPDGIRISAAYEYETKVSDVAFSSYRIKFVGDENDVEKLKTSLNGEILAEEPSVIISRRPCALLKSVKHNPPLTVDADKCKGCKACMKLGCPAISFKDGKAVIDGTQCIGCGLCKDLCAFKAII